MVKIHNKLKNKIWTFLNNIQIFSLICLYLCNYLHHFGSLFGTHSWNFLPCWCNLNFWDSFPHPRYIHQYLLKINTIKISTKNRKFRLSIVNMFVKMTKENTIWYLKPEQSWPFPWKPLIQLQLNAPIESVHVAWSEHVCVFSVHSSISG